MQPFTCLTCPSQPQKPKLQRTELLAGCIDRKWANVRRVFVCCFFSGHGVLRVCSVSSETPRDDTAFNGTQENTFVGVSLIARSLIPIFRCKNQGVKHSFCAHRLLTRRKLVYFYFLIEFFSRGVGCVFLVSFCLPWHRSPGPIIQLHFQDRGKTPKRWGLLRHEE